MLRVSAVLLVCSCITVSTTAHAQEAGRALDYEYDLPGTRVLPPPPADASDPTFRNRSARNAGIALTSIAAVFMGAGSTVMIYSAVETKGGDVVAWPIHTLIGGALAGGSVVLASVGIPLWVWGSGKPEQVPRLSLGAGSASVGWSF